jgi:hypothetical protein
MTATSGKSYTSQRLFNRVPSFAGSPIKILAYCIRATVLPVSVSIQLAEHACKVGGGALLTISIPIQFD